MAKIYGLFGAMTGKVADAVMVVRNGEQIVRKYQPVVANPSTPSQIEARAKLKLLSQLSAVMAPVIAMPRQGAVSSRNLFTKVNYPALTYNDNQADVTLASVKLTRSVVSLPELAQNVDGSSLNVNLTGSGDNLARVVYCCFRKETDGTLRLQASSVVTTPGPQNNFPTTFNYSNLYGYVVYAYGVRDNTKAARVVFGNLTVLSAETVAKVIVSRTLTDGDITLTETKALALQPGA